MTGITKEAQQRYGYTDDQVKQLKENQIRLVNLPQQELGASLGYKLKPA